MYVAAPQLWQAARKKHTTAETSPAEVPQVMKPLPSQGSDKHHILSSSLHSLPRSSSFFHFFCPLCHNYWSTQGHLSENWTDCHCCLFHLCSPENIAKIEYLCLFSNISTLFISRTMGKHLSSMLTARRKAQKSILPSPNTAWKNQPSSMKKSLQQSLLRGKICHPYFCSSWRRGQRCDSVQNGETQ